jgi:non-ribosomal peptide synthetase component F
MPADQRVRLKQWLESGEAQLHPLTFPQRELWETSPVAVEDNANHICCLIEVHGLLTEPDCRAAIQRVVDRQEALRLSILPGKERPLQMVRKNLRVNFDFREVQPADARVERIEELAAEIFREPFDLMQGPLYRVVDLCRAPNEHLLVFAIHHSVADGWSLGVMVQDLFSSYMQGVMGSQDPMPPVGQSYTTWGAADRATWPPATLEDRVRFWKTNLSGARRMWNDPITAGPPLRWRTKIPAALADQTRELTRRAGITLFNTLLGAFQVAFCEWSEFDELVVGTPVANRSKQNSRETMGYYAGIVPLRGEVDRSRTMSEHLRTGNRLTMDAFANAIPFVELVQALNEKTTTGYNPLFEVRFALQNHPMPEVSLPNLSAKLSMRSTGTPRFQLACEITEEPGGLEVVWLFRDRLFSKRDIEALDGIFQNVLARTCRSPESRISDLLK